MSGDKHIHRLSLHIVHHYAALPGVIRHPSVANDIRRVFSQQAPQGILLSEHVAQVAIIEILLSDRLSHHHPSVDCLSRNDAIGGLPFISFLALSIVINSDVSTAYINNYLFISI